MANTNSEMELRSACHDGQVLDPAYFKKGTGGLLQPVGAVAADFTKLHALGVVVPSAAAAHAHVVDLGNTATGTEIATAVNAVLVALETFGINASS